MRKSHTQRGENSVAVQVAIEGKWDQNQPESRANTMPLPSNPCPEFTLRRRSDGRFDAICMKCYLTAGTIRQESDLEAIKRKHECHRSVLSSLTYENRALST